MAQAVFSILSGLFAFGILQLGLYLSPAYKWLYVVGYVLFAIAFISAFICFIRFMWSVFVKGGWRKEHNEHLKNLEPKQPWE